MNLTQFQLACKIAKSSESLINEDIDLFDGFALPDFQPVYCTIRQVARLIRWQVGWQSFRYSWTWDPEELNLIGNLGRKRFLIVDEDYTDGDMAST